MEKLFRIISHTVKISGLSVSQKTKCGNFEKNAKFFVCFLEISHFFREHVAFLCSRSMGNFAEISKNHDIATFFSHKFPYGFRNFAKKFAKYEYKFSQNFAFSRESSRSLETLLEMQVPFSMI